VFIFIYVSCDGQKVLETNSVQCALQC